MNVSCLSLRGWKVLFLAVAAGGLVACGPSLEEESEAAEVAMAAPTESADEREVVSQDSVGTLSLDLGTALGAPVVSANTCGAPNQKTPPCASSSAPDHSFFWRAPYSGTFTFTTAGSGFDTVLHIYKRDVFGVYIPMACNDDAGGTFQSSISLSLSAGQMLQIVVDGYGSSCGSFRLNISGSGAPVKQAMTWSLLGSAVSGARAFALVGSDGVTNPYTGDTSTSQALPVLCINKNVSPHPGTGVIGNPVQTPGGAWRRTWSSGTLALTPPVVGTSLTSRSAADSLCGNYFGAGYRMAEFHDGDPNFWSGWDFWGEALGANLGPFSQGTRFWVSINDQNANPW